jgi:hypothetical protein
VLANPRAGVLATNDNFWLTSLFVGGTQVAISMGSNFAQYNALSSADATTYIHWIGTINAGQVVSLQYFNNGPATSGQPTHL